MIAALAFSPDGSRLASGSWDKTIRVWNTAGGESISHLVGHAHEVGTVDFLGGNDRLASFDADGVLKTWNLTSGNPSVVEGSFRRIEGIAGSPGSILAGWIAVVEGQDASWRNARLSLVDYRRRIKSRVFWTDELTKDSSYSALFSASVSADGRWLAAGTSDGTILVWRGEELAAAIDDPELMAPLPAIHLKISDHARCTPGTTSWHGTIVGDSTCFPTSLSFAYDSGHLAVSRLDGSIDVWDMESRTNVNIVPPSSEANNPSTCAFLGNGEQLAVVQRKERILILDSRDGHFIVEHKITPNDGLSPRLVGSPNGELVPLIHGSDIELLNTRDLTVARRLSSHQGPVSAVAFSPNGKRLVSASYDNTLKLWDVATGREISTLHGHEFRATSVLFLDDGATIVSGGHDNQIRFWDTLDQSSID